MIQHMVNHFVETINEGRPMLDYVFWIWFVGLVPVYVFCFYVASQINVYWYQINKRECLRLWFAVLFWPALPVVIYLNERRISKGKRGILP